MQENGLQTGLKGKMQFRVEEKHLARELGSGDARVLATPMLVAGVEGAALNCIGPYIESGQTSVGVRIDMSHDAGTPLGMLVFFEAVLTGINGRHLKFDVSARDEAGPVGKGTHERVLVDREKFEAKINAKRAAPQE